ncbi:putative MFS transporter [Mytilinidion resinicola]|uniref:MFS transporter n=1 Tax=Mytilinidion resinicola TaxID=574789 RepID=A0A6A6YGB1_9PEZI|nr:putative MFS transporter [Mytilinidion resinicola]KAF2807780.1 putative MFS transporter [Mytilinidion resinicola]
MFAILVALFLSLFIAALDATIVATAIPTISSELNSASGYTWIGGAYLLANAAGSPIWSKLSDIWGRKPILLTAVTIFFGSSILCAQAPSMGLLIVGRSFQGTAGGGLIQLVNITISDLFSMRSRSLYLGLLEFVWALAGGIGPIIGGVLAEYVSWRWIFWINLPVSGITFFLILIFLDVHNPKTKILDGIKAIDWWGSMSILGLTLMLLLGLDFGGVLFAWNSATVICLIVFGSLMSILFVFSEKRLARYPLMPLDLFRNRSNVASLVLCFLHGIVFVAGEYYMPLYFQSVHGASPSRSGLLVLPITFGAALMGITAGFAIHRSGRYLEIVWVGTVLLTIGTGLYIHFDARSSIAEIIIVETIAGFGGGLLFEPPLIALQAFVPQKDVATATATFGFIRNLATSLSIVIGGVIFQNCMETRAPFLKAAGVQDTLVQKFSGGEAAANILLIGTIKDANQQRAVKEAFAWSLRFIWIFYACIAACGVVTGFFIVRKVLSEDHVETKTGIADVKDNATLRDDMIAP